MHYFTYVWAHTKNIISIVLLAVNAKGPISHKIHFINYKGKGFPTAMVGRLDAQYLDLELVIHIVYVSAERIKRIKKHCHCANHKQPVDSLETQQNAQ